MDSLHHVPGKKNEFFSMSPIVKENLKTSYRLSFKGIRKSASMSYTRSGSTENLQRLFPAIASVHKYGPEAVPQVLQFSPISSVSRKDSSSNARSLQLYRCQGVEDPAAGLHGGRR